MENRMGQGWEAEGWPGGKGRRASEKGRCAVRNGGKVGQGQGKGARTVARKARDRCLSFFLPTLYGTPAVIPQILHCWWTY